MVIVYFIMGSSSRFCEELRRFLDRVGAEEAEHASRLREADRAIGGANAWSGRGSGYGLISTATFEGVALADVLAATGLALPGDAAGWEVEATGRDGYANSVPVAVKAMVAFGMNGAPLPRDHGAPLRLICPGVVGARQVKWLEALRVQPRPSRAPWRTTMRPGGAFFCGDAGDAPREGLPRDIYVRNAQPKRAPSISS